MYGGRGREHLDARGREHAVLGRENSVRGREHTVRGSEHACMASVGVSILLNRIFMCMDVRILARLVRVHPDMCILVSLSLLRVHPHKRAPLLPHVLGRVHLSPSGVCASSLASSCAWGVSVVAGA